MNVQRQIQNIKTNTKLSKIIKGIELEYCSRLGSGTVKYSHKWLQACKITDSKWIKRLLYKICNNIVVVAKIFRKMLC